MYVLRYGVHLPERNVSRLCETNHIHSSLLGWAAHENPVFRACYEQYGLNTVCCLFGLIGSGPLQGNIFISSGGILTCNASVICIPTEFNACDLVLAINIGLILLIKDK